MPAQGPLARAAHRNVSRLPPLHRNTTSEETPLARSLGAAPRPSSHCSHWADWAVVRRRAGRTGTRGMAGLVQSLTSYCSCLPPSPSLSHKLYLCLTLSTPFFLFHFYFFPQRLLICIARCLEPPDRVAQSKHDSIRLADSIFLQPQEHRISLYVPGTL